MKKNHKKVLNIKVKGGKQRSRWEVKVMKDITQNEDMGTS
jgi:hypothetical protein